MYLTQILKRIIESLKSQNNLKHFLLQLILDKHTFKNLTYYQTSTQAEKR